MHRLVLVFLAASACVLIGSCAGDANPPPPSVAVRGFVHADAPVVGAVITITDSGGVTVPAVSESRTSSAGSFELVTGALPANFTITATGGTYRGQPLAGAMRAAVVQFTPREIYYLTPVSSLVDAYAQAKHVPVAQAQDSVRRYLKISAGYKLDPFLRLTEKTFGASGFMTEAASHGGFDAFVATLVPEIGGSATRTFKARLLLGDGDSSLLSWVGTNLVAGAISAGGGMALTSLLAAGGVPTTSTQLADVQANLNTMSTQISDLSQSLKDMKSELGCEVASFGFEGISTTVEKELHDLRTMSGTLHWIANNGTSPQLEQTKFNLASEMTQYTSLHADINSYAAGSGTTMGAVRALGKTLIACGWFINAQRSQKLYDQYQYWLSAQLMACTLITNYWNAGGRPPGSLPADGNWASPALIYFAQGVIDDCKTYNAAIGALAVNKVLPDDSESNHKTVLDTRTGTLYRTYGLTLSTYYYGQYYADLLQKVRDSGFPWYTVADPDLTSFLTGCAQSSQALTLSCLLAHGWGAVTNVSGTPVSKDYYGPGGVFFWSGNGSMDKDAEIGPIAYAVMNWKGTSALIDCICYAAAMTSVKVPATDFYYRQ